MTTRAKHRRHQAPGIKLDGMWSISGDKQHISDIRFTFKYRTILQTDICRHIDDINRTGHWILGDCVLYDLFAHFKTSQQC